MFLKEFFFWFLVFELGRAFFEGEGGFFLDMDGEVWMVRYEVRVELRWPRGFFGR